MTVQERMCSFLAKWNDGSRTHVFSSAIDIKTIAKKYNSSSLPPDRQKIDWLSWDDVTLKTPVKGLRAEFLNAGTLKGHVDEFLQYLQDNPSYDIFGVAETRLGPLHKDDSFTPRGYSLVRQDRNTPGAGIAFYIKSTYKFTKLAHSDTFIDSGKPLTTEYLMGTIQGENIDPIFICLVYNPPDVSFKKNSTALIKNLRLHSESYCAKIIMGDFNTNLLSTEIDTRFLLDLAGELALKVIDHGPTHFATLPGTWIDVIFVGINDGVLASDNQPAPYHNRHNIIDVVLDTSTPSPQSDAFTYR